MKQMTPQQQAALKARMTPRPLTKAEKKKLGLVWKNEKDAAKALASLATPPKERTRTSGVQSKDRNGWK